MKKTQFTECVVLLYLMMQCSGIVFFGPDGAQLYTTGIFALHKHVDAFNAMDISNTHQFATVIKQLRTERGLSPQQLAEAVRR